MDLDMDYMQQAIISAHSALGLVSPNPAVGAVIVNSGNVVGLGATRLPGNDHAEIVALKQAGEKANGAELYVTLEPCSSYGKTPPCINSIISSGISKIHVAILDPNPNESGNGIRELTKAGIEVLVYREDTLVSQAKQLIESYSKYIVTGKPFITVKYAMSIDGKIATSTGQSQWISGKESRREVHRLRSISDAIIVGIRTVLLDNPKLTARNIDGQNMEKQPLRVVIDTNGIIPIDSELVSDGGSTLIVCTEMDPEKQKTLEFRGVIVEKVMKYGGQTDLTQLIEKLGQKEITSVLVEGGSRISGGFIDRGLVDKFVVFISPIVLGGSDSLGPISGVGVDNIKDAVRFKISQFKQYGDDIAIIGYA